MNTTKTTSEMNTKQIFCSICNSHVLTANKSHFGQVRGNTEKYLNQNFALWKCEKCLSIHSIDYANFEEIYTDYPVNMRKLDDFTRHTYGNLIKRLVKGGLKKHHKILDFGCGNGVFLKLMKEKGYCNVDGYDPYVKEFDTLPKNVLYDCVVANDVIEHVSNPRELISNCKSLLIPGGLFYIGTADSEPVDITDVTSHIMLLHQPFHRIIITQKTLKLLSEEQGFILKKSYRRSYMDTCKPFFNYRFLDEFSKSLGHNIDKSLAPDAFKILFKKPYLFFYAILGYYFPSAYEPAIILRKSQL